MSSFAGLSVLCCSFTLITIAIARSTTFAGPLLPSSVASGHSLASTATFCQGDLDFDCGEGQHPRCITSLWLCDNIPDCQYAQDEHNCNYLIKCWPGEFMCHDSMCILGPLKCNGHEDCPDGSDERGCPQHQKMSDHPLLSPPMGNASFPRKETNTKNNVEAHQEALHITDEGKSHSFFTISHLLVLILVVFVVLAVFVFRDRLLELWYHHSMARIDSAISELNKRISDVSSSSSPSGIQTNAATAFPNLLTEKKNPAQE